MDKGFFRTVVFFLSLLVPLCHASTVVFKDNIKTVPQSANQYPKLTLKQNKPDAFPFDTHLVKIGVFYTKDLLTEINLEELYAHIQLQVSAANGVLEKSGLNIRRQLAYFGQYPVDNNPDLKLNEFLNTVFDNSVEAIRTLSSQYGFDYITVLRPMSDPNYCGWAFYDSPYAVMQVGGSCLSDTLGAHEWGHNDGADHDIANSSSTPARPYGRGYNCAGNGTVMSTSHNWLARHDFYSSPTISKNGEACGEVERADVVRMLREFQFHNGRLGNRQPDREILAYAKITSPELHSVDEISGRIDLTVSLVDQHDNQIGLDRAANIEIYTVENTAKANQDYVATAKTVHFAAGVQDQQVEISIIADASVEPLESFSVGLRHGDIIAPKGEAIDVAILPNETLIDSTVEFSESELTVTSQQAFFVTLHRHGNLSGTLLAKLSTNANWLSFDSTLVELPDGASSVSVNGKVAQTSGERAEVSLFLPQEFLGGRQLLVVNVSSGGESTSGGGQSGSGALYRLTMLLLLLFLVKSIRVCQ